jgi:hypothetical protein
VRNEAQGEALPDETAKGLKRVKKAMKKIEVNTHEMRGKYYDCNQ